MDLKYRKKGRHKRYNTRNKTLKQLQHVYGIKEELVGRYVFVSYTKPT